MITAGIDIGHQSVKAVILENDRIISQATRVIAGAVDAANQPAAAAAVPARQLRREIRGSMI